MQTAINFYLSMFQYNNYAYIRVFPPVVMGVVGLAPSWVCTRPSIGSKLKRWWMCFSAWRQHAFRGWDWWPIWWVQDTPWGGLSGPPHTLNCTNIQSMQGSHSVKEFSISNTSIVTYNEHQSIQFQDVFSSLWVLQLIGVLKSCSDCFRAQCSIFWK